jgi:hypothetical protein
MKWRPISELSDEQKDGRWWTFAGEFYNEIKKIEGERFCGKDLEQYRYCNVEKSWMSDEGSCIDAADICETHFLSEPLPDFPKPQKMEWRRFGDELPQDETEILVYVPEGCRRGGFTAMYSRRLNVIDHEDHWSWMPIIPPEDE